MEKFKIKKGVLFSYSGGKEKNVVIPEGVKEIGVVKQTHTKIKAGKFLQMKLLKFFPNEKTQLYLFYGGAVLQAGAGANVSIVQLA